MIRSTREPANRPGEALLAWLRSEFELSPAEDEMAQAAAECLAHVAALRELLAAGALLTVGSMGQPKAHPALAEIRNELTLFRGLMHDLNLPADAEPAALRAVR
jgi:hypothetical protein